MDATGRRKFSQQVKPKFKRRKWVKAGGRKGSVKVRWKQRSLRNGGVPSSGPEETQQQLSR